eukprot:Gb_04517 [translate_table: standard]
MEHECCVVTGGRGFAARHLVCKLLQSGRWIVRIADLAHSISLDYEEESSILGEALKSGRAVYFGADLRDKSQLLKVFQGASVVYHMAAPDSSINNFKLHYDVTVQGTRNVISACLECKVKKLIYTSSPSVVFDGVHGIINGDESLAYPDKYNDVYSETKAEAEAMVLRSNGREGLLTCALRPSSIFGPGDKLLVPSLVAAARAGKSKFIIGDGENMYDFTYVENVAHAHICAEKALDSATVGAAGKAYFITNMEPIKFWEFMSLILEGLGYERPQIRIPAKLVMPIAWMVEWTYKKLAPYGMAVPQLTPSRIRLLSCTRTFNCSRAQKYIGYSPVVPLEEGIRLTLESYQHLRLEVPCLKSRGFDEPSKVYKLLGGGRVANVLLWRDEKQTFTMLLALVGIFYCFFVSGYTFICAAAKLLLLISVLLFIHGVLPSQMFGYTIEKIPSSTFEISEETTQYVFQSIGSAWNSGLATLRYLAQGKDWNLFLKAMSLFCFLKFLGSFSVSTLVGVGLIFMFTAFYIYEQKEEEIDSLAKATVVVLLRLKEVIMSKLPSNVTEYFH